MIQRQLGDLIELRYGKSLRKDTRNIGTVPVFGSNGQVGVHNESLVDHPTIIVGRKGSIGEVHLVKTPCWPIDTTYFVEPLNEQQFDLDWLYHLLRTLRLQELNRAAAIPGLNRDDVYRIPILLPAIDDQIRIAYLLGKVERLIGQRKQNLQQLEDLLNSVFLEMFGPKCKDYGSWPLVEIRDLAAKHKGAIRTGPFGSNMLHSEFTAAGDVAVLGIDNAVQNRFAWGERRFITSEKYSELAAYRVYPGDVIITIMGTTGRSAVIPDDIPLAINTKHLAAITLDRAIANPLFVSFSIHSSPYVLSQLNGRNRGAIMSGLNLGIIKDLELKRPPIELQNQFAENYARVDALKSRYQQSLHDLEALYGSLSQQAFKGELILSDVQLAGAPGERAHRAVDAPSLANINLTMIDLPDSEQVSRAVKDREGLKVLLHEWLESYKTQLNGGAFSLVRFMRAAQTRLTELHPDSNLELDSVAYEYIKTWLFDALTVGTLTQIFDDEDNCVTLKSRPAEWGSQ